MKISEVFSKLNEEQKEIIKQLSIKKSKENFNKTRYKGMINDSGEWIYNGCYDTGRMGNGKCTNGHSLRYAHIAVNVKTGEKIVFGIKCIHEFFNITDEKQKEIEKSFNEANKIIKTIYEMVNSGNTNYIEKAEEIEFIEKYSTSSNISNIKEIKMLINAKLPIPWFMTIQLDSKYKKVNNEVKAKEFLENNEELNAAITLYELIKNSINEQQFSWELSTMASIKNNLFDYGSLSYKQIKLFIELVNRDYKIKDYSDAKNKLETIMKVKMSKYDVQTVCSLYFQLNSYNKLSENQLKLVDKIYFKYRKQINALKEEA